MAAILNEELVLWCFTPPSTIFQLYRDKSVLMVEESREPREKSLTRLH